MHSIKVGQPLEQLFEMYGKFGDTHRTGDNITLKNLDKWFHQAGLIEPNGTVKSTDTSIVFSKIAK